MITQFVASAMQGGVDVQVITQGILELLAKKETPTVDSVLQQMEQQIAQQEQQAAQAQQQQERVANTPQEGEQELGQLIQQVEASLAQGTPMDQIVLQLEQAGIPNEVIQGIMQEINLQ